MPPITPMVRMRRLSSRRRCFGRRLLLALHPSHTYAVDARRLLLLRTVLRAGSMGAAARSLGMTQPAVSQQLAVLEREVGIPLVLRSTTGVRPTEAGSV